MAASRAGHGVRSADADRRQHPELGAVLDARVEAHRTEEGLSVLAFDGGQADRFAHRARGRHGASACACVPRTSCSRVKSRARSAPTMCFQHACRALAPDDGPQAEVQTRLWRGATGRAHHARVGRAACARARRAGLRHHQIRYRVIRRTDGAFMPLIPYANSMQPPPAMHARSSTG